MEYKGICKNNEELNNKWENREFVKQNYRNRIEENKQYIIKNRGLPIQNTEKKGNLFLEFTIIYPKLEKDEIKAAIDTGETETKSLEKPIIVHITYLPVWVDDYQGDKKILWGEDPYSLEPKPFY